MKQGLPAEPEGQELSVRPVRPEELVVRVQQVELERQEEQEQLAKQGLPEGQEQQGEQVELERQEGQEQLAKQDLPEVQVLSVRQDLQVGPVVQAELVAQVQQVELEL